MRIISHVIILVCLLAGGIAHGDETGTLLVICNSCSIDIDSGEVKESVDGKQLFTLPAGNHIVLVDGEKKENVYVRVKHQTTLDLTDWEAHSERQENERKRAEFAKKEKEERLERQRTCEVDHIQKFCIIYKEKLDKCSSIKDKDDHFDCIESAADSFKECENRGKEICKPSP